MIITSIVCQASALPLLHFLAPFKYFLENENVQKLWTYLSSKTVILYLIFVEESVCQITENLSVAVLQLPSPLPQHSWISLDNIDNGDS